MHLPKYISVAAVVLVALACSTRKNTFLSRNSHALSSKYNILYNGGLALDKGVADLRSQYQDNFWERLPIERMQVKQEATMPGETPKSDPNFERAETKATKAIQKHSMNIGGGEKNPQMDEAHLMLGKARYYDKRFIPALEAFNYILYKYPNSDKIYEAKIWREKTNVRLDNDQVAVDNLRKLLDETKLKDHILADANAALAQAFLNLNQKDSAISRLQRARDYTKLNEEKARYYFILGQLFEETKQSDSAFASFQSVIDMHRRSPRQYTIHAHAHQANQFDYKSGDTIAFLEKYHKMLEDRENRPYLDVLNHQMALFYDRQNKDKEALSYYNASLKKRSQDQYMVASNYRNMAQIYFDKAQYVNAGKYYDSTLVQLEPRTREFKSIQKKRLNLNDVIKYEAIANRNDSILKVVAMNGEQRIAYYQEYIDKLKIQQEAARIKKEKDAANGGGYESTGVEGQIGNNDKIENLTAAKTGTNGAASKNLSPAAAANPTFGPKATSAESTFYFYNPSTVAFGKNEFRKNWGDRAYRTNWRVSAQKGVNKPQDDGAMPDTPQDSAAIAAKAAQESEMLKPDFYIAQLPTKPEALDSIGKERNFAYFQLGVIYKEKFREYQLAAGKLEKLLEQEPEERLVLPALYNLYKICEITDKDKAIAIKNRIITDFPDSRYAQILQNPNAEGITATDSPQVAYGKLFNFYESGDYKRVVLDAEMAIEQYTGEEIVPKIELLKAAAVGKLKGVEEYKKALNYVALTYPNSEEGKKAESMISREIVWMEALQFNSKKPLSWKLLFKADNLSDAKTIALYGKINKFIKDRSFDKIKMSVDIYTMDKNFIVIHGMKTEDHAKGIQSILKEFKDYKIQEPSYVISNENYKVVQIKKNFDEFLLVGNGPIVETAGPTLPEDTTDKKSEAEIQMEQMQQRALENKRMQAQQKQKEATSPVKQNQQQMQANDPKSGNNVPQQIQNQQQMQMQPPGMMMPPQPGKNEQPVKR